MTKATTFDREEFKKSIVSNCKLLFRKTLDEANDQQIFQAVAYSVKDIIMKILRW